MEHYLSNSNVMFMAMFIRFTQEYLLTLDDEKMIFLLNLQITYHQ